MDTHRWRPLEVFSRDSIAVKLLAHGIVRDQAERAALVGSARDADASEGRRSGTLRVSARTGWDRQLPVAIDQSWVSSAATAWSPAGARARTAPWPPAEQPLDRRWIAGASGPVQAFPNQCERADRTDDPRKGVVTGHRSMPWMRRQSRSTGANPHTVKMPTRTQASASARAPLAASSHPKSSLPQATKSAPAGCQGPQRNRPRARDAHEVTRRTPPHVIGAISQAAARSAQPDSLRAAILDCQLLIAGARIRAPQKYRRGAGPHPSGCGSRIAGDERYRSSGQCSSPPGSAAGSGRVRSGLVSAQASRGRPRAMRAMWRSRPPTIHSPAGPLLVVFRRKPTAAPRDRTVCSTSEVSRRATSCCSIRTRPST